METENWKLENNVVIKVDNLSNKFFRNLKRRNKAYFRRVQERRTAGKKQCAENAHCKFG